MILDAAARKAALLWRCLAQVPDEPGFYIDVGATDPDIDSATRICYDHGWRGITLAPSPACFARRRQERPRDVTIEAGPTLTEVCARYAPEQIHVLTITVAAREGAVLRGMDFTRFRPWVLVVEAAEPDRPDAPTCDDWEPLVRDAGYELVHRDVPNRFYVAREHPELIASFALPADDHVRARELRRIARLEAHLLGTADPGERGRAASG